MQLSLTTLVLAAVLLCGAALAQDSPRLATKEQYTSCLDAQEAVEHRAAVLARHVEEHKALAARIQSADDAFAAQVRRKTPRTPAEVASYNKAIEQRNQAARDFNERGRVLDRDQESHNAYVVETNASCSFMISAEVKQAVDDERRKRAAKP